MEQKRYKIRFHHLFNLVNGFKKGYEGLRNGILNEKNNDRVRRYTDNDAEISISFYTEISSDPRNTMEIVEGIDDRCIRCSNYDGEKCTAFSEKELFIEDNRVRNDFFPNLHIGDLVTVQELLYQDS
ncbi:hypothetical protein JXC34_07420 [Candidatus Woesearchaeota archaeon]|nr:hypothetical protein [Candidatus Woesearchaeota archaeon]